MTDRKNFFRSAFDAMVVARSRTADKYINSALAMIDEETLKAHGIDRKRIGR
ncbi:MAG: hypothetical protein AAFP99_02080 [Pseudomonadota bacterium]